MIPKGLKVNILKEFDTITEYWSPRVIQELNGQYIKIAKLKGEFVWHDHEFEDELFYIIKGKLDIEFEDKSVILEENEFYIVPKKTKHFPKCKNEVWVMLLEPISTKHTGDIITDGTKSIEEQIQNNT
jgi:mannose-6-phosphate isomerase-like protein (cupin superfamily)